MPNTEAFFTAITSRDPEAVAELLDREPELGTFRDDQGRTPLLLACYYGATDVVDVLIGHGVQPDLHAAALLGDIATVEGILEASPEAISSLSADGWTPLHLACFFGREEVVTLLTSKGASINILSENAIGNTPLHAALAGTGGHSIVSHLINTGADINATGESGIRPLHLAASRGDGAVVELLLERGAIGYADDKGMMPEDYAAERGHTDVADRLRSLPPN